MSDLDELLAAFDTGRLLRPSHNTLNIVDLSLAIANLCGAEEVESTPGSMELAGLIGPSDHLVFVLVDGLGKTYLDALPPDSFLRKNLVTQLHTVFPSSSATAITSLATGEWPSCHGVTGRWTHFPEIETVGEVLPYVSRGSGRSLTGSGMTPEMAFPAPPLIPKMKRDTVCFFPDYLADSVYSNYFSGGAKKRGYRSLHRGIDEVINRVNSAQVSTYTYFYTPQVDSVAHKYGSSQGHLRAVIRELDRALERLLDRLAGRYRLVVSADHGLLDVPTAHRRQIKPAKELTAGLRVPPSGDARVLYFHVHNGYGPQVKEYLQTLVGEYFLVIDADEAVELKLLGPGPLSPLTRDRIGDVMAISRGTGVVEYRPDGKAGRIMTNASHHSGLTPAEIQIPLVVA